MIKAVPSRITCRRPLMVRQPYSVAVLSTGGRLHPSFQRREGLVRMWSSLWLKGDGGIRKMPFLMVKKDGIIFVEKKNGKPCLPTFLKSRMYIDMSSNYIYELGYAQLLRDIYSKPLLRKPALGKKAFLYRSR